MQSIYNDRSKYFQDFVGGNSQFRFVGPSETVDFRASLDLMPGVSLRFEALNLFNEPKSTYMPVYGSSRQYHYYGSKYFIGLRARIRSEEHTSELQSLMHISYAVFCLKKKKQQ